MNHASRNDFKLTTLRKIIFKLILVDARRLSVEGRTLNLLILFNFKKFQVRNFLSQITSTSSLEGLELNLGVIKRVFFFNYFKKKNAFCFSEHGTSFLMDCNTCSCYAGEIVCTKAQCRTPQARELAYTSLPCNCVPHHVPVCGRNGVTYPNSCLAK